MAVSFQPGSAETEAGVSGSLAPEDSGTVEVVRPPVSGPWDYALLAGISSLVKRVPSLLPDNEDELPPLLITTGEDDGGGECFSFTGLIAPFKPFYINVLAVLLVE